MSLTVMPKTLPDLPAGHPLSIFEVRVKTDIDTEVKTLDHLDGVGAECRWHLTGIEYQLQVTQDAVEVRVAGGSSIVRLRRENDRVNYPHFFVCLSRRCPVVPPALTCECGAAKCGVGRGMAGHSPWCPESPSPS